MNNDRLQTTDYKYGISSMKLNNADFIKLISESLDDINYDDISDDTSSDEFGWRSLLLQLYSKRIGGGWRIAWEDKVATGIWFEERVDATNQYRRCGHEIQKIWNTRRGFVPLFLYDYRDYDFGDDKANINLNAILDELNINLNAILAHRDFWKTCRVGHWDNDYEGYWDNDNEELYSGIKISSIEPDLKDNLIKLGWAFTEYDEDEHGL